MMPRKLTSFNLERTICIKINFRTYTNKLFQNASQRHNQYYVFTSGGDVYDREVKAGSLLFF